LTPYRDNGHLTAVQDRFNELQSSLRMVIERSFGILKKKWDILDNMEYMDQPVWQHIILVTCILHNLFINTKEVDEFVVPPNIPPDDVDDPVPNVNNGEDDTDKQWRDGLVEQMFN